MDNVSPFAGETADCSRWRANVPNLADVTAILAIPLQPHRLNGYSIKMPSETLRIFRRHLPSLNYKSNSAATGAWSLGRSSARVSKSTRTSFNAAAIAGDTKI